MTVGTVQVQGQGLVDFTFLAVRCGSKAGGRDLFEKLIQDLAGVQHPDISTVEANPGDWGIDAFVGSLLDDAVAVWQAKYFIDGFEKGQQGEVRKSYKSARDAAAANGYSLQAWTLAVPVSLDGPMRKWWEGWKKKTEKADGVIIELWDEGSMRRQLLSEDARDVYEYYFNPRMPIKLDENPQREVRRLNDPADYDGTLFVEQMRATGALDFRSAKEEFFNAEIMTREITDKGVDHDLLALAGWRSNVFSLWSHRFNDHCQRHEENKLPGLIREVMESIADYHQHVPKHLGALPLHGYGIMHQSVDAGDAGWVRDWLAIAHGFREPTETQHPAPAPREGEGA